MLNIQLNSHQQHLEVEEQVEQREVEEEEVD